MCRRCLVLAWLLVAAMVLFGCSGDDSTPVAGNTGFDFGTTLADFSDKVVVATYADLATKATALNAAVTMFAADPSNQTLLDNAAAAWVATREPWETSEAFLFGPAAFLSLDPSIDSWPVDRNQLDNVLASSFQLTADFISDGLGPALRGFHTIEYLLFRNGQPRVATDVTSREREYLIACTQVLADDAATLHDEWAGGFAVEFAKAGTSGSRYVTQGDAVLEIIEGMIAICDEVANGKIADPFDQQNVDLVESQFSWNSLTDFQNNIRSAQNAYSGGFHLGVDGVGIDEFVAAQDGALDARLKIEIQAAIDAIAAVPEPFRDNLDKTVAIEAAQQAAVKIVSTLELDIKPLLNN